MSARALRSISGSASAPAPAAQGLGAARVRLSSAVGAAVASGRRHPAPGRRGLRGSALMRRSTGRQRPRASPPPRWAGGADHAPQDRCVDPQRRRQPTALRSPDRTAGSGPASDLPRAVTRKSTSTRWPGGFAAGLACRQSPCRLGRTAPTNPPRSPARRDQKDLDVAPRRQRHHAVGLAASATGGHDGLDGQPQQDRPPAGARTAARRARAGPGCGRAAGCPPSRSDMSSRKVAIFSGGVAAQQHHPRAGAVQLGQCALEQLVLQLWMLARIAIKVVAREHADRASVSATTLAALVWPNGQADEIRRIRPRPTICSRPSAVLVVSLRTPSITLATRRECVVLPDQRLTGGHGALLAPWRSGAAISGCSSPASQRGCGTPQVDHRRSSTPDCTSRIGPPCNPCNQRSRTQKLH